MTCSSPKQRLLLGVLLLHANEVVSSDRLIEALWGEEPPATAVKALQMHVSQLRKLLGDAAGVLVTRAPGYELRVGPGQLDLERFERAVRAARADAEAGDARRASALLHDALALWRGPPLADLSLESFVAPDLARLEELRLVALEDRIDADLALGRHAEVVGELEGLAAAHPLRERVRAQLMLALYRSGRQADALEAYRDTRRLLVDELGIEPGPLLKDLERAILAQDPALALSVAAPPPPSRDADTLVGRERELNELRPLVEHALHGSGAMILIAGEPGIGKSRMAETLARHAGRHGARVLVGRCWEAGGAPAYWPWVQALRAYVADINADALRWQVGSDGLELATLLPELRERLGGLPSSPPPDSEGARFRLFDAVASFLRRAGSAQPVALFFDDLHAADASSLLLLQLMARELNGAAVLIVGCYRDTDVEAGDPLAETLPELTRERAVRRIALRGLSPGDTRRLLELTVGDAVPDDLTARVQDETTGNPLFAIEIARLLAAEELTPGPGGRLPIPEGVREAIGRRLAQRTSRCREVLTLASVAGREFAVDALERAAGLDQDALYQALEEAIQARLVGEVPGSAGRLRFSHVLIRDTIYDELPVPRRLRHHRALGAALEALYAANPGPHLAELAYHYLEAGSAEAAKAIDYAARAGERAASQLAYEEAARLYGRALELLETWAGDERRTCELLLARANALSRAGDEPAARAALHRAADIAERSAWPDLLARSALDSGRFLWGRSASDPAFVPLIERALTAIGPRDSEDRARLLARLAAALRDDERRERRVAIGTEAVEMARRVGDPATLAYVLDASFVALEGPDAEENLARANELLAQAEKAGSPERAWAGHEYRLFNLWELGDRAAVDVELEAIGDLAAALRQPARVWFLAALRAMVALMEGELARAEELVAEAREVGERGVGWNAEVTWLIQTFVLRRAQGRLAELEDVMRRSVHRYPTLPRFKCALAHLEAALGHEREARAMLDELFSRDLLAWHVDAEWMFAMSLLADPCAALADAEAATRLREILLPYEHRYSIANIEATFGSVARCLGVLETALGRFDDAEAHFVAALDMEHAMRARPWVAEVERNMADMRQKKTASVGGG